MLQCFICSLHKKNPTYPPYFLRACNPKHTHTHTHYIYILYYIYIYIYTYIILYTHIIYIYIYIFGIIAAIQNISCNYFFMTLFFTGFWKYSFFIFFRQWKLNLYFTFDDANVEYTWKFCFENAIICIFFKHLFPNYNLAY